MNSAKSWCFTLNNYTDEDEALFKDLDFNYLVYGREIAPKTNTPHLQGYIIFKKSIRLAGLKKIHEKAHWEASKGSKEQNRTYCTKGGIFFEGGESEKGKRNDLLTVAETIRKDGLVKAIELYPDHALRYFRNMKEYNNVVNVPKPRNFKPQVIWLHGSSGTGKTRYVLNKEKDVWTNSGKLDYWDGYKNQECVLLDDFRAGVCPFYMLLKYLDRYPLRVNVKFGSEELNSKRIYITSCFHPKDVYKNETLQKDDNIAQLLRRIDEIINTDSFSFGFRKITDFVTVTEVVGNTTPPQINLEKEKMYFKDRKLIVKFD